MFTLGKKVGLGRSSLRVQVVVFLKENVMILKNKKTACEFFGEHFLASSTVLQYSCFSHFRVSWV